MPWLRRANKALNKAVRIFPRCNNPLGLGAKRVLSAVLVMKGHNNEKAYREQKLLSQDFAHLENIHVI
jgi:hypothetical protein